MLAAARVGLIFDGTDRQVPAGGGFGHLPRTDWLPDFLLAAGEMTGTAPMPPIHRGTQKPRSCRPFLDGIRCEFRGDGSRHYEISGATPASPPARPREFLCRVEIEIMTLEGIVSIATDWPQSMLDKQRGGTIGKASIFFMNTSRIARIAILATATCAICAFIPRPAQATVPTFTDSGSGFSIPDNNPTVAFSDIVVADNFLINDITVGLNAITHSWIGDLIVTLTHIDTSTTVDLFNRVGQTFLGGPNAGSDLNGTYNFNDALTGDLWTVASSGGSNSFIIPGGDYFPTGVGSSAKVPMLTTISGLPSSGTWRLNISDRSGSDVGTLGSWSLNLQGSSPASVPGPLPLLGAGAAFGWSRRLRKRSRTAL